MRNKLLSTAAFTFLLTTNISHADTYQVEGSLDYTSRELQRIDIDEDVWQAKGTYYFSAVNTRNHPLAEAAFLEKASNISLQSLRNESSYKPDFGDNIYSVSSVDKVIAAHVEVYIPDSIFYVSASVARVESITRSASDLSGQLETNREKFSDNAWIASLGLTPISGLLIFSTFYEDVDLDEHWNLNAKYVTDWSGNALNIEGFYADSDGNNAFGLLGDFYFDRTFSAGVGYISEELLDSDNYIIRAQKFFTSNFSIRAQYSTSDYSDDFSLGADLRF